MANDHNIIINKADNGSTIVLRHRDDYIREGLEHLSDTNTYLPLTDDYTNVVTSILTGKINQLKNDGLL